MDGDKDIPRTKVVMRYFNNSKQIFLLTDASRLHGVGFALGHMERDQDNIDHFKIVVKCSSNSLSSAQKNYWTIELQYLVIVWAIKNIYIIS